MARRSLVLVTSNPQKAREIQQALRQYHITVQAVALDIPEIKTDSLAKVVADKAQKAYALVRQPVLVDDTGIFFQGYHNFPGAYARSTFVALGWSGLLRLICPGQRAYFCSYLAYQASATMPPQLFRGVCRGRLITALRGRRKAKMPYDNIFIPDGDWRTFSQMSVVEKQQYDHRSKAVRKFAHYFGQL